mmetsp:Transcript_41298/g.87865  ORF Transcript_41298/g.87865 Transcript_41298/m.87865 type:complete len:205 (+) Transcript_41298:461-1075(+)
MDHRIQGLGLPLRQGVVQGGRAGGVAGLQELSAGPDQGNARGRGQGDRLGREQHPQVRRGPHEHLPGGPVGRGASLVPGADRVRREGAAGRQGEPREPRGRPWRPGQPRGAQEPGMAPAADQGLHRRLRGLRHGPAFEPPQQPGAPPAAPERDHVDQWQDLLGGHLPRVADFQLRGGPHEVQACGGLPAPGGAAAREGRRLDSL